MDLRGASCFAGLLLAKEPFAAISAAGATAAAAAGAVVAVVLVELLLVAWALLVVLAVVEVLLVGAAVVVVVQGTGTFSLFHRVGMAWLLASLAFWISPSRFSFLDSDALWGTTEGDDVLAREGALAKPRVDLVSFVFGTGISTAELAPLD